MYWKIAKFFIENSKLTFVLVLISIIAGIWSYISISKQYNPSIIVAAFEVSVIAPWLNNEEISQLIVSPLENKIMELEWIDKVYWFAWENYWWVMLKFKVGIDKEKAKIRLNQKLNENLDLKPLWVQNPIIKNIDPEQLAQISFAISYKEKQENNSLSDEEIYIYLRQVANIIKDELKTINNVTSIDIVWWFQNDLIINLDLEDIEAKNIDIIQVYDVLKKNNISLPLWDINNKNWEKISLNLRWKLEDKNKLENLIIGNYNNKYVYLKDIAEIKNWVKRINKESSLNWKKSVFLWVWKAIWTNSVFITNDIIKKIEELKKTFNSDIEISIIQNEWETAKNATDMLIVNLIQSIIIVFLVLALYLWKKDAINTSLSIPLSLWLVFLLALIAWENINRITLFALILVLWMIVDNSTVVVENISRHLNERRFTLKSKLEAVLSWVQEVWTWIVLSTISRLLSFWAMFAVGWMMWEYMWAIPLFAIRTLLISLVIAFSINPWISYNWARDIDYNNSNQEIKEKESIFKIRKKYLAFMKIFIYNTKNAKIRRKIFKIVFFISLISIIVAPIYFWIFKARMLPKSNQNQIYVWIDASRSANNELMKEIWKDLNNFFYYNEDKNIELQDLKNTVKEVAITSWQSFVADFANLFRWWNSRFRENQLSARINLYSSEEYIGKYKKNRLISEEYTIKIRPYLKEYLLKKYKDLDIRLLEDPPGPPVRSTFLTIIKWDASQENQYSFFRKVEQEIINISKKQELVDLWNSISWVYKKINIIIDHDSLIKNWLSSEQVANTIAISINSIDISLLSNKNTKESTIIKLGVKNSQIENKDFLKKISFTNTRWEKIHLDSIAKIEDSFVWNDINTDSRKKSLYIYSEMWNNSLIYPIIELFNIFLNDKFLNWEYKIQSWSPYWINYIWIKDWKNYTIEFSWEWELTMDTFRDLWIAMILSLLAIYFLLVWQYASFWVAWIIMITFLLSFFWIFSWFSILFILNNEYFSATSMIWLIALWWIVVWNAIILIDYLNILRKNWLELKDALLKAWYLRFSPIILTSLTTVFWAATIIWDPVWSWLAWSIIWGLFISSILTLIVIPIFYYDSQEKHWNKYQENNKS